MILVNLDPNSQMQTLQNITTCIPVDKFNELMTYLAWKHDAINLGKICFVTGLLLGIGLMYAKQRWG